ncbi:glycosyltransferase [Rhodococcus sp. SORGH_AS_0301]|uniref:glycosyltransferase n=1 Tax=Rhodococcus sp. SORGH_AS_0301 TaxID=3041780 RepID=UPI0027864CB6|nr:glycosyltransferase [Rhodococcus sp. SORGH_AS_0301]MDQ1182441.1 galactofuranosylgalactofuranosylrhamnosyl-N-acetylglucosaminyl-diphospho-decaprenol beta-1,5/1,6-galactofuranosyltransferase [Rhodococcus sp. SORGH_AS_0301]
MSEDQLLGRSLLQRILLPRAGEPLDVRTLYTDEARTNPRRAHSLSRTSVSIGSESEVSFGTYFNAFPASYWRRWSTLDSVVLRVELIGHCRVDVYRSKADGSRIHVQGGDTDDATTVDGDVTTLEFVVELGPFEDGGWIWFDVTTDTDVEVRSAGWFAPVDAPGRASVAIGIPTFNRPTDCVKALTAIASDPLVMAVVDAVIVPDQGTRKVRDEPGFDDAAAAFGDLLSIHDQANLGGSGGYSRIMYEALENTDAEHILFMDDDIEIEPDSILRALAMARFAKVPTLVGGQMLNLQARSHLHVMGEKIDTGIFMWGGAQNVEYDHDFAEKPLRESTLLHRRIDVDYNGWWMCLIPRVVAETIGQPLPLFIKWDDAEYGLRAREAGFPTVTLPGAAIWHMAWSDKDDAIDWQAYFHLRNRLVVAALHSPGSARGLVVNTVKATMKHLLCLEYSTVAIQNMAIRDFLAGPEHIMDILPTALAEVHRVRRQYADAVVVPSSTLLPPASGADVPAVAEPVGAVAKVSRLAKGLIHNARGAQRQHHDRPQLNVPTLDARWYLLSQVDGVTVTTADGRGVVYRKRDPKIASALLGEALSLRRELASRFPELSDRYRRAVPELTSKERWERVFSYPN